MNSGFDKSIFNTNLFCQIKQMQWSGPVYNVHLIFLMFWSKKVIK